uniref:CSON015429 protein n=1 Tax=Culicoides sonorensis TaxID=179676 RepID=A0A336LT87_CULSO
MSVGDAANYLLFTNPVSSSVWGVLGSVSKVAGLKPKGSSNSVVSSSTSSSLPVKLEMTPLWKLAGTNLVFVRIAAVSGASAVFLGAWGAHKEKQDHDLKQVFETANRYHFFHSLALLAVPLARRPMISGSLMLAGTVLFSGTLYYRSVTGDNKFNRLAPIGGITLIFAWLSLVL